ncbi:nuclear autoantigenic sperm protein isoform X2 [Ascaphus truei]|uniref:nuclear autoantigenic sperm protein isoform X2 n=1 Tax=Ascaphus truei TaxID=8439 RepID=UPI003F59B4C3
MAKEKGTAASETEKMEDVAAPSTSADQTEGVDVNCVAEAKKLMGLGHRHLVMKDMRAAVNAFQEASSLLAKKYGETADECAEAFYSYGMGLLELARVENGVLGNALEGMPEDEEGEKEEDPNIPSADNLDGMSDSNANCGEKEREQLREQVYDAMAEDEEKSAKGNAETEKKENNEVDVEMEECEKPEAAEKGNTETTQCITPEKNTEAREAKEKVEEMPDSKEVKIEDQNMAEAGDKAAGDETKEDVKEKLEDKPKDGDKEKLEERPAVEQAVTEDKPKEDGDKEKLQEKDAAVDKPKEGGDKVTLEEKAAVTSADKPADKSEDAEKRNATLPAKTEKEEKAASKEENKEEKVASKEENKGEKVASKEENKGEKVASKEENKGEKVASKEENKGEKAASKEENKEEKAASKEEKKGEKAASKEEKKGEKAPSKEENKGEKAASTEENKGEKAASKEENKGEKAASKEENKGEKAASTEENKGEKAASKEENKGEKAASKEENKEEKAASASKEENNKDKVALASKEENGEEKAVESEEKPEEDEDNEDKDPMEDEGVESEENEDTEDKENEEDDVGSLQLAWEMLELAKVIFQRQQTKESQLKAAQAHLKLGEVSIESENYSQAVEDFVACLNIQKKHLEEHDRLLAETHYQLGLAYQYSNKHEEAISHFNQSVVVIEKRMVVLTLQMEKAAGEPALDVQKEMDELKGLLPDIKEKIEDSKEAQTEKSTELSIKETLAGGSSSGFSQENGGTSVSAIPVKKSSDGAVPATNCASDISHLVRKKRKPEEESPLKEKEAKKSKQELVANGAGSGDAVVPTNEAAEKAEEEEKHTPMETAAVESTA